MMSEMPKCPTLKTMIDFKAYFLSDKSVKPVLHDKDFHYPVLNGKDFDSFILDHKVFNSVLGTKGFNCLR